MILDDQLRDQITLYQLQVAAMSASRSIGPAERRSVEDIVALGVAIFDRLIQRKHSLISNGDASKLLAALPHDADVVLTLWKQWLDATKPLRVMVETLESAGAYVDRSRDLKKSYEIARLEDFDRQRLVEEAKAAIEGRYKPLREAADEFRRRRFGSRT